MKNGLRLRNAFIGAYALVAQTAYGQGNPRTDVSVQPIVQFASILVSVHDGRDTVMQKVVPCGSLLSSSHAIVHQSVLDEVNSSPNGPSILARLRAPLDGYIRLAFSTCRNMPH
jgi:hypothetical protein